MNPRILADRWLRADLGRFASSFILAMVGAFAIAQFVTSTDGATAFGPTLGADYAEFYAVGTLLNQGHADRLYDLGLQDKLLHRTVPAMPVDEHLPFVYPPFLAPIFRPLANLPYSGSFAAWLGISLACYAASVGLMIRGSGLTGSERSTAWLLALSFEPFAIDCWLGGQLSSLGGLAVASGLTLNKLGRPFLAGMALSALLYKPTLPLLIVPVLLIGRRWSMVAGFGVGGISLALLSWIVVGGAGCLDFGRLMLGYGQDGGSVTLGFKTVKYIDLRAFLGLLGIDRGFSTLLAGLLGLPTLAGLATVWWRANLVPQANLAWAATLCWTPVLNPYGPIYDASIVVPGLILAAGTLRARAGEAWPLAFRWILAGVYLGALISPAMARGIGFQPLTVALGAMGAYLLRESLRSD